MHINQGFNRTLWRTLTVFVATLSLAACQSSSSDSGGTILIIDGAGGAGGEMMTGAGGAGAEPGAGGAGGEMMDAAGGAGGEMMAGAGGEGGVMNGAGGVGGGMMGGAGGAGGGQDRSCDTPEYVAARESFQENEDGFFQYLAFSTNPTAQNPMTDVLLIELHPSRGFPMEAGTYDLAEVGSNIGNCQICVLSFQGINVSNGMRRMNLMATEGEIEITSFGEVGDSFALTMNGVTLRQVNITRNQAGTLVGEFPSGGEELCLDGYELDAVRKPLPARIGQPVLDFQLQNCATEEMVSVAEIANSTQAVWFLGTAGWCPACRNLMLNGDPNNRQVGSPFEMAADMGPERLRIMIVLGENAERRQADLRYCRQYARTYADNAADFYLDHDGTRAFAQLFAYLNTYASDAGMFGLPWNGVVSGGDEHVFRYADRSGQPERLGQIINELTTDPAGPMDGDGEMGGE